MLYVQTVCPKDNDRVFNLPRTGNHTGMMMPLSLWGTISEKPHSYPWFIFPFISIDHSDSKNHSFINAGLAAFVLVQVKFTKCTIVTHSLGSFSSPSPLYNLVGVMWQGWIYWVMAVWLPLLTRDKGNGRIFSAIYLSLINSQLLSALFFILSRKLYFGTLETVTFSFVETNRIKQESSPLLHSEIKGFHTEWRQQWSVQEPRYHMSCPFRAHPVPLFKWAKLNRYTTHNSLLMERE